MSPPAPLGRFVWRELMTSDPAAAQKFYPTFMGWGLAPWEDGSYTMWMNGEAPVGGVMTIPDEAAAMGVPPNWVTYIGTPDCDATAAKIVSLGGSMYKEPWDIPGIGRIAIVADPQGVGFGLYTSLEPDPGLDAPPAPGQFSWQELSTTDPAGAIAFYQEVFGWDKMEEVDMGPMGTYHLLGYNGVPRIGLMRKPDEVPVPNWLPYLMVADVGAAFATAKAHGATPIMEPMEVPDGSRVCVMADPQGAVFGVHSLK